MVSRFETSTLSSRTCIMLSSRAQLEPRNEIKLDPAQREILADQNLNPPIPRSHLAELLDRVDRPRGRVSSSCATAGTPAVGPLTKDPLEHFRREGENEGKRRRFFLVSSSKRKRAGRARPESSTNERMPGIDFENVVSYRNQGQLGRSMKEMWRMRPLLRIRDGEERQSRAEDVEARGGARC